MDKKLLDMCRDITEVRDDIALLETEAFTDEDALREHRKDIEERVEELKDYIYEGASDINIESLIVNKMLILGKEMNKPEYDENRYMDNVKEYQKLEKILEVF